MPRSPSIEPTDDQWNNLRFLAEKTATPETLPLCDGLLAVLREAGIAFEENERAELLRRLLMTNPAGHEPTELVLAARDLIYLTDRSRDEVLALTRTPDGRRQLPIQYMATRRLLAGTRFGVGPNQFRKTYEGRSLQALLSMFRDAVKEEARRRQVPAGHDTISASLAIAGDLEPLPAIPPGYVHREREETEFHRLVATGAKVIVFVGQPGMGKTWLAKGLIQGQPFIRVDGGRIQVADLARAFEICGANSQDLGAADPTIGLARLLSGENAPRFVVLDNLNSTDELSRLLPVGSLRSVVVATCRSKGDLSLHGYSIVPVDKMTESEAAQIVKFHAPQLNTDDAVYLARFLGEYPLALDYTSTLLAYQEASVRELCRELLTNLPTIAQHAVTGDNTTLHSVLGRIVKLVKDRDVLAYELLVYLSFMNSEMVGWEADLDQLVNYARLAFGARSPVLRCAQALHLLRNLSLISVTDSTRATLMNPEGHPDRLVVKELRPVKGVSIAHPLTLMILSEHLRPGLTKLYSYALQIFRDRHAEFLARLDQDEPTVELQVVREMPLEERDPLAMAWFGVSEIGWKMLNAVEDFPEMASTDPEILRHARELDELIGDMLIVVPALANITLVGGIRHTHWRCPFAGSPTEQQPG